MSNDLQILTETARDHVVSAEERQAQRRSFAYGNTKLGTDRITREMVDEQDESLKLDAETR